MKVIEVYYGLNRDRVMQDLHLHQNGARRTASDKVVATEINTSGMLIDALTN